VSDEAKPRYRCPRCKRGISLWQGVDVTGWRSIDDRLEPLIPSAALDREVYWEQATPDGCYGCSECEWEGGQSELEPVGLDGEPLPFIHEGQQTIEAEA
jgi:hypothetical protein